MPDPNRPWEAAPIVQPAMPWANAPIIQPAAAAPVDMRRSAPISDEQWYQQTYGRPAPLNSPNSDYITMTQLSQMRQQQDPAGATAWQQHLRQQIDQADPAMAGQAVEPLGPAVPAGVQGVGRGLADAVGMLPDIANLFANGGLTIADFVAERFGGNVDYRFPMLSDTIANTAANVVEDTTGLRSRNVLEMTPEERFGYDVTRYGTGALAGGGVMRGAAALRPASDMPRTLDPLLKPYEGAGFGNTLARDTTIGAGAGTGIWGAEELVGPENIGPVTSTLAMLAGGGGGAGIYDLPTAGAPAAWHQLQRGFIDRNIPYDANGAPTSRGTAEDAARYVQEAAGGADAAAAANTRLGQVVADMGTMGAPVPPLGQATQNVGLARVERSVTDTPGGTPIIDRNREITTWAGGELQNIAPTGDPALVPRAAADTIQQRTGEARAGVAAAEEEVQNAVDLRRQAATPVAEAPAGRDAAALQIDDTVINRALVPMAERSREMYGAVDPRRETPVDVSSVQTLAAEVARTAGTLADPARTIPGGLLRRIRRIGQPARGEGTPDLGPSIRDAELADDGGAVADYWRQRDALNTANMTDAQWQRWEQEHLLPLFPEEDLLGHTYPREFENNLAAHIREVDAGGGRPPGDGADGRPPTPQDVLYGNAFSALRRVPLRRGETWRQRALTLLARSRAEEARSAPAASSTSSRIRDAELSDDDPGVLGMLGAAAREAGPVEVPIGEIVDVLPAIGDATRAAFDNGNPVLGQNLRKLKNEFEAILNNAGASGVEAGVRFQDAQQNWRGGLGQTFARPGSVSETLRTNFNKDPTNRGFSPPSATAPAYLQRGRPENAADLVRVYDQTSDPAALVPAANTFILAAAPQSVLTDGMIDPAALSRFVTDWGSVIDAVPGLRAQFDDLLDQAARGEQLHGDLAKRLTEAQGNLALTQEQMNDSALSIVAGRSPRRAVEALMGAPNPAAAARDLRTQLAGVPGADESLQRAVADWLYAKVTNSNPAMTTDGTMPVSPAKLVQLSDDPNTTALLAEVFDDPEAMNALQRVRTVLDLRGIIGAAQGTPGSPTAANLQASFKLFEAGMRMMFGGFTGGNYARNFRVAFDVLFNKDRQRRVVDLVARAQIDPRIASHLLTLDVAPDPVAWASKMGKLMRWAEFSRQMWETGGEGDDAP